MTLRLRFVAVLALGATSCGSASDRATVDGAEAASLRFTPSSLLDAHECLPVGNGYCLRAYGRAWSPGATGPGITTSVHASFRPPMSVGRRRALRLGHASNGGHYAHAPADPSEGLFLLIFRHGDEENEVMNTTIAEGWATVVDVPAGPGAPLTLRLELRLSTGESLDVTLSAPVARETC